MRLTVVDRHVCAGSVSRSLVHRLSRLPPLMVLSVKSGKAGRGGRTLAVPISLRTPRRTPSRPLNLEVAASTSTPIAPCRALLQTSGRLPPRRPSSPPSERTANLPSALRCCLPVCSCSCVVEATRSRANTAPALLLTGFFGLSTSTPPPRPHCARSRSRSHSHSRRPLACQRASCRRPGFDSIWVCIHGSELLRHGRANSSRFGAVYMICAVGVYV